MLIKKLPVVMRTFQELIQGDYKCADMTQLIHDLVQSEGAYFLSRPRWLGKSLLLSTFKALFSGPPDPDGPHQCLFKDLWIGQESDYDFNQKYPVVTLDMSLNSSLNGGSGAGPQRDAAKRG
jgi:hypothetical protein